MQQQIYLLKSVSKCKNFVSLNGQQERSVSAGPEEKDQAKLNIEQLKSQAIGT